MLKKILYTVLGGGVALVLSGAAVLWWLIVFSPGEAIRQENIEKILAVESPVYYSDGRSRIGVFFEQAHRQYVPYARIPKSFVNAIVAAEDHDFFSHHGVDFPGVFRALLANIKAGRVVQGGSTITQQTAKNLFKRKERSLSAKARELLYAWRLEYWYPKEKILEFYANQFYVSGNGRGLGVAARYYFDKPVAELDILESAFIAGSVKRPNYYNPFIKKDEKAAAAARKRARARTRYVLNQMYQLGMINAAQYQKNIDREIPFRQGRMYYSLNTIMDLVKSGLAEPEVEEAFSRHGIDNVATSGIRIVTTIEKDLQEQAFYALRKELSRLDVRLRGYDREALQKVYAELPFASPREMRPHGFLVGRVASIHRTGSDPGVVVSFGRNDDKADVMRGRIDAEGLMNLLTPLVKYTRQRWSPAGEDDLPLIFDRLKEGDLVYVSIRDIDSLSGRYLLDLEKYPELEGAVLALKDGSIRAMVGGRANRFYNRAIYAKRPMGSVIKPLVYCAALQLGWNSLDTLNNQRNVFVFQNTPYFPRPDHHSPHRGVSMSWAGVHSENLATIWLLYHLCDQLAPVQFKEIADHVGLGRRPGESHQAYRKRIRDKYGIVVGREALRQAAFEKAVAAIEPDLLFAGRLKEQQVLSVFHYGAQFDTFLAQVEKARAKLKDDEVKERAELELRRRMLLKNFLRYTRLRRELLALAGEETAGETTAAGAGPPGGALYFDPARQRYVFTDQDPRDGFQRIGPEGLARIYGPASDRQAFLDKVMIDGLLSSSTVGLLQEAVEREYSRLAGLPRYSPEVLYAVRDFKVLVALEYLTGLCRDLGIESRLDPVLSFPLGSNVISVLEVARAYEGMSKGGITVNGRDGAGEGLAVIDRIEDSDGEVIYAPDRSLRQVVDPRISLAITDILRNVVKFGTGRYADKEVRLHSHDPEKEQQLRTLDLRVPVIGKTGTANRFTNAAFAGVVPGLAPDGTRLSLARGYVLASYVGFDDNTPMVRTSTHLSGASGALPLWVRLANAIFLERDYAARMDLADLSFSGHLEVPLARPDMGQIVVPVEESLGGLPAGRKPAVAQTMPSGQTTVTTFGKMVANGEVQPARFFQPYWQMKEN